MKFFSKSEAISVIIIFLVLIAVSWPNFAVSIRRARDQVRMDDIGNIQAAVEIYYTDNGFFPTSLPIWGQKWVSPVLGADKVSTDKIYMNSIPNDPNSKIGTTYLYFSDGGRYQLFGAFEGLDEAGYDTKLAALGIKCGNKICNFGRSYGIPLYDNLAEYDLKLYCGTHPSDVKCTK
jgi:type II secretory pathway pseudopilin PulG